MRTLPMAYEIVREERGALGRERYHSRHLPEHMYYLGKEEGGLGLRSLRTLSNETRIKQDLQLRNDWVQGKPTVHSEVVCMAWERYLKAPDKEHSKSTVRPYSADR